MKTDNIFEQTMLEARKNIDQIEKEMRREFMTFKKKLSDLQKSKEPFEQIYQSAARLKKIESQNL